MRLSLDELRVAESTARQYPHKGGFSGFHNWMANILFDGNWKPCNCIVGSIQEFRQEAADTTRFSSLPPETQARYMDTYREVILLLEQMGLETAISRPEAIREAAPYLATIIRCAEMTQESEKRGLFRERVVSLPERTGDLRHDLPNLVEQGAGFAKEAQLTSSRS